MACFSEQELIHLANYFKLRDGRIHYSHLCELVQANDPEIAFLKELEWKDPCKITLSDLEKRRLDVILEKIAQSVRLRDLPIRPYFDGGNVTFNHFYRVLTFLGLRVAHDELGLLLKCYMKDSQRINCDAFANDVEAKIYNQDVLRDPDYSKDLQKNYPKGGLIDAKYPKVKRPEIDKVEFGDVMERFVIDHNAMKGKRPSLTVEEVICRIKKHLLENPVRVEEFFEKFDTFRTGCITKGQFKRGLDAIGVSGLGRLILLPNEIEDVANCYLDADNSNVIWWKEFCNDISCIFTVKQLHKKPWTIVEVPPGEIEVMPRMGSNWCDCVAREWYEYCHEGMLKIMRTIAKRKIDVFEWFKDFDRHKVGHVTKNQWKKVLDLIGALLTIKEEKGIEKRYMDELGFDYVKFLKEVCSKEPWESISKVNLF